MSTEGNKGKPQPKPNAKRLEEHIKDHFRNELEMLRKQSAYLVGHDLDGYDALFPDDRSSDKRFFKAQMIYLELNVREIILDGYHQFFIIYREGVNNWFARLVDQLKSEFPGMEIVLWLFVSGEDAQSKSLELKKMMSIADEVEIMEHSNYATTEEAIMKYVDFIFSMYDNPEAEALAALATKRGIRHVNGTPGYLIEEMLRKGPPASSGSEKTSRIIPFTPPESTEE